MAVLFGDVRRDGVSAAMVVDLESREARVLTIPGESGNLTTLRQVEIAGDDELVLDLADSIHQGFGGGAPRRVLVVNRAEQTFTLRQDFAWAPMSEIEGQLVSASGTSFAVRCETDAHGYHDYVLDLATSGQFRLPSDADAEIINEGFDGGRYFWVSWEADDDCGFEVVDIETGQRTQLPIGGSRILWGASTETFYVQDGDGQTIRSLDEASTIDLEWLDPEFSPSDFCPGWSMSDLPDSLLLPKQSFSAYVGSIGASRSASVAPTPASPRPEPLASVRLVPVEESSNRTRIGGEPDLPADVEWPTINGGPVPFLAQVDLAEIHAVLPIEHLPTSGLLSVFYCPMVFEEIASPELVEILPFSFGALVFTPAENETRRHRTPELFPAEMVVPEAAVELRAEETRRTLDFDINDPSKPEPVDGYRLWQQRKDEYEATLIPGPLHRVGGHGDKLQPSEHGELIVQLDGLSDIADFGDGGRVFVTAPKLADLESDFSNAEIVEESH